MASGDVDEAARLLGRALAGDSGTAEDLTSMARLAFRLRRSDLELAALRRVHELGGLDRRLALRLVDLLLWNNRTGEATAILGALPADGPGDVTVLARLAACHKGEGQWQAAADVLRRASQRARENADLVLDWAAVTVDHLREPDRVRGLLSSAEGKALQPWTAAVLRGRLAADDGDNAAALGHFERATLLAPDAAVAWHELAVFQRRIGQIESSQASLLQVMALQPDNMSALRLYGLEHRFVHGDPAMAAVTRALSCLDELAPSAQIDVHYAAGKAFDDIGDDTEAFGHYGRAGALHKSLVPWDDAGMRRMATALTTCVTADWIAQAHQAGHRDSRPVFVIGMPRSGTSLVEQLIAAHPLAFGAGEVTFAEQALDQVRVGQKVFATLPANAPRPPQGPGNLALAERGRWYVERLAQRAPPDALRIVDKMPGNCMWAGLLGAMLPDSRFIHCRRHPVDTCLSMFRLHFGASQPFSYDLRDLGRAYRCYHDIMAHWDAALPPGSMLTLRYEDVVQDPAGAQRRLMDFLGLPDAPLLRDHRTVDRQVRTASAAQVRQPVYRHGVGRWQRYEAYLRPLLDELGDLAEYERH